MKIWRGQPDNFQPFPLSPKEKGHIWLAFSGLSFLSAANSYMWPASSAATGRWAWIHNIFYSQFGSSGDLVLYVVAGSAFLLAALSQYGKASVITSKSQ
ncbi:MAG: hypothetical protein J0I91_02590 [Candidatus Accumulibacter sp.]|nr:hypothetical protein [Accumulibacter sp.]